MVDPERKLIGHRRDGGRGGVGAVPKRALRIIGQWITSQHGADLRVYGHQQGIVREGGGIYTQAFLQGWNRKYLRRPQYLAESLVLAEEISPLATVVKARDDERASQREAKFVARKVRDPAGTNWAAYVKEVARVERGVAQELEEGAVEIVGSRAGDYVSKARSAMADFRWHNAGAGADFL